MGYRACLGILRLEKIYGKPRLEAASQRAVQLQAFSYQSVKLILKRSLDRQSARDPEAVPAGPGPRHENLRGPFYYDPPTLPAAQLGRFRGSSDCRTVLDALDRAVTYSFLRIIWHRVRFKRGVFQIFANARI